MKRILKVGKDNPNKDHFVMRVTCPHCGCEFECVPKDLETGVERFNIGTMQAVTCPICGGTIHFIPNEHFVDSTDEAEEK